MASVDLKAGRSTVEREWIMKHSHHEQDPRVRATAAIWAIAVGMLGVCIPLVAITNSGLILPILVIVGASVSSGAIWLSSNQAQGKRKSLSDQTVEALEERVRNLEAICSAADWDLQQPSLPTNNRARQSE
jgi:hypothetical protein